MPILRVAILGLALTVLAGCGTGHGLYRHGYNDYHGAGSGDNYHYSASYSTTYGPDGRVYPGYVNGQSGYCGW